MSIVALQPFVWAAGTRWRWRLSGSTMTPSEHNKYVGIANVAYGTIHVLLMIVMALFFMAMMRVIARDAGGTDTPPASFFGWMVIFVVGLNFVFAIPSFIAGYAFLK